MQIVQKQLSPDDHGNNSNRNSNNGQDRFIGSIVA